jgi:hypothetical protein
MGQTSEEALVGTLSGERRFLDHICAGFSDWP